MSIPTYFIYRVPPLGDWLASCLTDWQADNWSATSCSIAWLANWLTDWQADLPVWVTSWWTGCKLIIWLVNWQLINWLPNFLIHCHVQKKMALYILPQFLENLTKLIGTHTCNKPYFFRNFPWTNNIVHERFEVFRLFLCVFMSGFRIFVHYKLWVNVPDAIFFSTVDPRRWIDWLTE